jgi:hypothetical protein
MVIHQMHHIYLLQGCALSLLVPNWGALISSQQKCSSEELMFISSRTNTTQNANLEDKKVESRGSSGGLGEIKHIAGH